MRNAISKASQAAKPAKGWQQRERLCGWGPPCMCRATGCTTHSAICCHPCPCPARRHCASCCRASCHTWCCPFPSAPNTQRRWQAGRQAGSGCKMRVALQGFNTAVHHSAGRCILFAPLTPPGHTKIHPSCPALPARSPSCRCEQSCCPTQCSRSLSDPCRRPLRAAPAGPGG